MFGGIPRKPEGGYQKKGETAMPKRVTPLSGIQAKSAKQKDADYKIADGGGLYLLVTTTGGRLWQFKYFFEGKEKLLTFGAYPEVSLESARKKRDEACEQIAAGSVVAKKPATLLAVNIKKWKQYHGPLLQSMWRHETK
jgi:hypothetical protein